MRAPRYFDPTPYVTATDPFVDELDAYSPYQHTGTAVVPYQAPTLAELWQEFNERILKVNREIAGRLGLDPRYTMSSNIGLEIAARTGIPFAISKGIFHGGVAGAVALMLGALGAPFVAAVGLGAAFFAWLQSFDSLFVRQ